MVTLSILSAWHGGTVTERLRSFHSVLMMPVHRYCSYTIKILDGTGKCTNKGPTPLVTSSVPTNTLSWYYQVLRIRQTGLTDTQMHYQYWMYKRTSTLATLFDSSIIYAGKFSWFLYVCQTVAYTLLHWCSVSTIGGHSCKSRYSAEVPTLLEFTCVHHNALLL